VGLEPEEVGLAQDDQRDPGATFEEINRVLLDRSAKRRNQ
jgi:hypothetical protein